MRALFSRPMIFNKLDKFTLLHQPHGFLSQPSLSNRRFQFLDRHFFRFFQFDFARIIRRQYFCQKGHDLGQLLRTNGMLNGESFQGVILHSQTRQPFLCLFRHGILHHRIHRTVPVPNGSVQLFRLTRFGGGEVATHDDDTGEGRVQLKARKETQGAALGKARQDHARIRQAGGGMFRLQNGFDPGAGFGNALATLVGAFVETDNVVPRWHWHAHVHRDGLCWGCGEDEFQVWHFSGELLGNVGKSFGSVTQSMTNDHQSRLCSFVLG
mmetsp:Transcript_105793/g.158347  ORF Transcript_105793/g.158347 Transcript_105793/m.158347 type:complete len:268 (-) Transcript_105793:217-1020(-)